MPKTEFLQIRLSPEDRARVERAAAAAYLDVSTWARQVILRELHRAEPSRSRDLRVAETPRESDPSPPSRGKRSRRSR